MTIKTVAPGTSQVTYLSLYLSFCRHPLPSPLPDSRRSDLSPRIIRLLQNNIGGGVLGPVVAMATVNVIRIALPTHTRALVPLPPRHRAVPRRCRATPPMPPRFPAAPSRVFTTPNIGNCIIGSRRRRRLDAGEFRAKGHSWGWCFGTNSLRRRWMAAGYYFFVTFRLLFIRQDFSEALISVKN